MSNLSSFHKATDALYKKSLRSLFSIYSILDIHSDEPNIKLFLKLFDSLIKPILLYGSEVWGLEIMKSNNLISKFTNKFYRTLLGVQGNCSTVGTHIELGRHPIDVNIHVSMIKYWFRLVTLPKTRLVSHCYWSLLDKNDPWFNHVKSIINCTGQSYLWKNQKLLSTVDPKQISIFQSLISKTLQDQFIQYASAKMDSEPKLYLFKNSKTLLQPSQYLLKIKDWKRRSLLAKFRLGTTELELEKGRKTGVPREQRFCRLCNTNNVENEVHFLLECPSLNHARLNPMNKIITLNPALSKLPNSEKLNYLYFNENIPRKELDLASELLASLQSARDTLRKS